MTSSPLLPAGSQRSFVTTLSGSMQASGKTGFAGLPRSEVIAVRKVRRGWGLIGTGLVIAAALPMVAPFGWMFAASLKSGPHAFDLPPAWVPTEWHVQNYLTLFRSNVPFATFLWNSLKIASVVTLGQLLTCSMAGYAFAHLRFRGAKGLFPLLLTQRQIISGMVGSAVKG
jgi:ABC-type glycerol-3-phosphate transport system permease component